MTVLHKLKYIFVFNTYYEKFTLDRLDYAFHIYLTT